MTTFASVIVWSMVVVVVGEQICTRPQRQRTVLLVEDRDTLYPFANHFIRAIKNVKNSKAKLPRSSIMFAALASGTVDQSILKEKKNPLLDLKPKTPPPQEPEEETR